MTTTPSTLAPPISSRPNRTLTYSSQAAINPQIEAKTPVVPSPIVPFGAVLASAFASPLTPLILTIPIEPLPLLAAGSLGRPVSSSAFCLSERTFLRPSTSLERIPSVALTPGSSRAQADSAAIGAGRGGRADGGGVVAVCPLPTTINRVGSSHHHRSVTCQSVGVKAEKGLRNEWAGGIEESPTAREKPRETRQKVPTPRSRYPVCVCTETFPPPPDSRPSTHGRTPSLLRRHGICLSHLRCWRRITSGERKKSPRRAHGHICPSARDRGTENQARKGIPSGAAQIPSLLSSNRGISPGPMRETSCVKSSRVQSTPIARSVMGTCAMRVLSTAGLPGLQVEWYRCAG